jgi:DNA-directed RNA polymerase I subunit RPA2
MFIHRKVLYYVPLILLLKCLINVSDKFIYNSLISGCDNDVYYQNCILNMMRAVHEKNLHSHEQCKAYIGKMFRIKFFELPISATDIEICDFIIQ